ncbi:unnamed protein product, partial [Rotaria magnacalcarata]
KTLIVKLKFCRLTVRAGHDKGDLNNWKPVDSSSNASTVDIILYQSNSWTLTRFACYQTKVNTLGYYTDLSGGGAGAYIDCQIATTSCTGTGFSPIGDYNTLH